MRYGYDLGCRYRGIPHDLKLLHENPKVKWEKCNLCSKTFRWNKGYKSRIDNQAYLKAHIRNFCQKFGATKRIYNKIYNTNKTIIKI